MCGRLGEMNLRVAGIKADHFCFDLQGTNNIILQPLSESAKQTIRINGILLKSMDSVTLETNDKVFLGPNTCFLVKKNSQDSVDITYDQVLFEIVKNEGGSDWEIWEKELKILIPMIMEANLAA